MMHLESTAIGAIREEYLSAIKPLIKAEFSAVAPMVLGIFSGSPAEHTFFDSKGDLNDSFLTDLLCQPFPDLTSRYPWVDDYLNMGKMIYCYSGESHDWKKSDYRASGLKRNAYYAKKREEYLVRYKADTLFASYHFPTSPHFPSFSISAEDAGKSFKDMENFLKQFQDLFDCWNSVFCRFLNYDFLNSDLKTKIKKEFNLDVCPYCNRQYITSFCKASKETVTADLDHFYPQSRFPLFSLSLYNLVPSCLVCNRMIKSGRFQDIWYPYEKGFDKNTKFEIDEPGFEVSTLTGNNDEFNLKLVNKASTSTDEFRLTDNTLTFFKFEEIYQSHKQYVRELLYKKHAYSEGYLKKLQDIFRSAGIGPADANLILYGHEIDDTTTDRRILGKLAYDIING